MSLFRKLVPFFFLTLTLLACSSGNVKRESAGTPVKSEPAGIGSKTVPSADGKAAKPTETRMTEASPPTTSTPKPEANAEATGAIVRCTFAGDERTITRKDENGGCAVNYTKAGETAAIASARSDLGHCDRVRDKVRATLENAGFKCL